MRIGPAGSVAGMASVEVIGVYTMPEAPEPCHLIEIVVRDSSGFDVAKFVQPDPTQSEENWQVAYMTSAHLTRPATAPLPRSSSCHIEPELLEGDVRLVFFMH